LQGELNYWLEEAMAHGILLHETIDDVGVAVRDLSAGTEVGAVTLEGQFVTNVKLVQDVPLGHKIAMRDMASGKHVLEYGRAIGKATQAISCGQHVHTHNLRTLRWDK
jgi:(2R)-sulfolactate sulfo-lyase subunit alpha